MTYKLPQLLCPSQNILEYSLCRFHPRLYGPYTRPSTLRLTSANTRYTGFTFEEYGGWYIRFKPISTPLTRSTYPDFICPLSTSTPNTKSSTYLSAFSAALAFPRASPTPDAPAPTSPTSISFRNSSRSPRFTPSCRKASRIFPGLLPLLISLLYQWLRYLLSILRPLKPEVPLHLRHL